MPDSTAVLGPIATCVLAIRKETANVALSGGMPSPWIVRRNCVARFRERMQQTLGEFYYPTAYNLGRGDSGLE